MYDNFTKNINQDLHELQFYKNINQDITKPEKSKDKGFVGGALGTVLFLFQ